MKDYILLFRGGDSERKQLSPEELQANMQRWQEWIAGIAQTNQFGGGHPLSNEGKVLQGGGKKPTDGPFIEGKEILGGYVLVKARDMEEAVRLAAGCPNLEASSGTVEIRENWRYERCLKKYIALSVSFRALNLSLSKVNFTILKQQLMDASINSLNWFEISVSDIARAKKFYETVFSIQMDQQEMMGMQMAFFPAEDMNGKVSGALVQGPMHKPSVKAQ